MWAKDYWGNRYWAARYWSKVGATPTPPTGQRPRASRYLKRFQVRTIKLLWLAISVISPLR